MLEESRKTGSMWFTTKEMAQIGMFAAILAIISQMSVPMPTGVPITIQLFGIALTGKVLGKKKGTVAVFVYILLGAVGLPIFSNFRGGFQVLAGMSGGYIAGWPIMAYLCGIHLKGEKGKTKILEIVLALIGVLVVESLGGLRWAQLAGDKTFLGIMIYSFTAFIPKDMILTILAMILGTEIKERLLRAGIK